MTKPVPQDKNGSKDSVTSETPKPQKLDNVSGGPQLPPEAEAVQAFLADIAENMGKLMGELEVYKMVYGELPIGQDYRHTMWGNYEAAKPLLDGIVKYANLYFQEESSDGKE